MTGQIDLFGGPDIPCQRKEEQYIDDRPSTDDIDLVISVIRAAKNPGYVVIGITERIYRRTDDGPHGVDRVPDYENGAVHQLIEQGLLKIGGGHTVNFGGFEGRANSVLVPRTTLARLSKWESLARPNGWGRKRYTNGPV